MTRICEIGALDRAALLALNNEHARELNLETAQHFDEVIAAAAVARGCEDPLAFLIAFDERQGLAGPNYDWFKARYARFMYVDRIVVEPGGRRGGVASALYADLEDAARAAGHTMLCCEINSDPPNPASDAFHARQGFTTIGEARLADRGKTVRYLAKSLEPRRR